MRFTGMNPSAYLIKIVLAAFTCLSVIAHASATDELLAPFKASYVTEWSLGWFTLDIEATRTLQRTPDGNWLLTFEAETSAASLKETSEFSLIERQIRPQEYQYHASGLFNEPDRALLFSHPLKLVKDLDNKQTYTNAWETEIQDNLSYMLQASIDLAQGDTTLTYEVFEKNRSKPFRFEVIGEETIDTSIGKLKAVKVKQIRKNNRRELYAWFAKDHHYQLVRLIDKKDGRKRYQIDISTLSD